MNISVKKRCQHVKRYSVSGKYQFAKFSPEYISIESLFLVLFPVFFLFSDFINVLILDLYFPLEYMSLYVKPECEEEEESRKRGQCRALGEYCMMLHLWSV